MAEKTLKDQNGLRLALVVVANVVALYGIAAAHSFADADWILAGKALGKLIPAGLGAILIGVLNAQLDAMTKARIVFLRWKHPLPGAAAFTTLGPKDPRVDMAGLKKRLGELPTDPAKQDTTWYALYREVADKPSILHAHKEYLFTRDYHVLALGMFVVFGIASIWAIAAPMTRGLYVGGLLLQALLTGQAARNHGRRLVCSVLAISTPLIPKVRRVAKQKT